MSKLRTVAIATLLAGSASVALAQNGPPSTPGYSSQSPAATQSSMGAAQVTQSNMHAKKNSRHLYNKVTTSKKKHHALYNKVTSKKKGSKAQLKGTAQKPQGT